MPAVSSAEEILAALEKTPAFVAVVRGPSYVYEFISERYATIVGISDPIGKSFGDSHHPAVVALRAALDHVYDSGEAWNDPELRLELQGADGAPVVRWFDVHFLPLHEGDRVDGVLIHSYDVTALVRAREEAREHAALREKMQQVQKLESLGVLAGGVAHDFNNMLSIVVGNVSAAATQIPADSPAHLLLSEATDGAMRAAALTRQLLTYAGRGRAETRPIDLSAHVRDVAHLLAAALPRTVTLQLELTPGLAPVTADPAQFQQIVMNLLINAGEAIGASRGRVVVSTGVERLDASKAASVLGGERLPAGEYAFVDVRDDGPGMDEATVARIFDPFFSTKAVGPSARGLGLAAVVGIVRGHGGGIRVRSVPGAGAHFRVLLPLAEAEAASEPSVRVPESWRGKGTVLVVDDDAGVRAALAALLEVLGFDVVRAEDGASGLARVAENPELRLIVVDMRMPGMTGPDVAREVRRIRPDLPVLLASGDEGSTASAHRDAPAAFLRKPFTMPELVKAVRAALASRA